MDARKSVDNKAEQPGGVTGGNQEEERAIGTVDGKVWATYAMAAGGKMLVFAIFLLWSFEMGVKAFNESWLGWWADDQLDRPMSWYLQVCASVVRVGFGWGFVCDTTGCL
jgi:hypothetical protein